MYTYEQSAVRAEAKRYCYEHEITDRDDCGRIEEAIRHRAFMQATEPYRNQIAKLYGYRFLKRIILGDSESTTEYEWISPEAPKLIAQLQGMINSVARNFGYSVPQESDAL